MTLTHRRKTFEPFRQNVNLIRLSACINPEFADRITLFKAALGDASQDCLLHSNSGGNIGNGHLSCEDPPSVPAEHKIMDQIHVRVLDDLLGDARPAISALKIDTDGV